MKNEIIKKKFKELVKQAIYLENKCSSKCIDFIETRLHDNIVIGSKHYNILIN